MSFALAKVEEIKALPAEQRVLSPEQQLQVADVLRRMERVALSRRIRGKYAHIPTSAGAFIARKVEEIALEDRRR